jgi:hypothetical protein
MEPRSIATEANKGNKDKNLRFPFSTAKDELRNEIGRPPGGLTQGNTQSNKIFSVHDKSSLLFVRRRQLIKLFQLVGVGDYCC